MFLGKLFGSVKKEYRKISVEGICFDSRKVRKKDIFFAIEGEQTSGTKLISYKRSGKILFQKVA